MDERSGTTIDTPADASPCPCLAFGGPAGCPACHGRGELTQTGAQHYIGADRVACLWCDDDGLAPQRDNPDRRFPCPSCLGTRRMPVRAIDQERMDWMATRVMPPGDPELLVDDEDLPLDEDALFLEEEDLSGADLSSMRLKGWTFQSCSFANANFTGASITGCTFEHCDFTAASIDAAELDEVSLVSSRFAPGIQKALEDRGATVEDGGRGEPPPGSEVCANCEGYGCWQCDDLGWIPEEEIDADLGKRRVPCLRCGGEGSYDGFGPVSWGCTTCMKTKWMRAEDLAEFDIAEDDLPIHPFEEFDLSYSDLRGCTIPASRFSNCKFTGTDFQDAVLSGCQFMGSDFTRTNLERAASLARVKLLVDGLTPEQEAACVAKGAVILEEWEDDEEE